MWCLVVHSLDHSVRIRLDTQHVFCAQTRARSHAGDNIFCSRCICLLLACSPRGKKKQKKTVISAGYSPRHFLWEMVNKRRPREASRSVRSPKDTLQIMSQCTSPQQTRPRCLSFEFLPLHWTDWDWPTEEDSARLNKCLRLRNHSPVAAVAWRCPHNCYFVSLRRNAGEASRK